MASAREAEILTVAGREVAISHPGKVLFPQPKHTKLGMRGRYSTWTRIRVNLQHVPEDLRPAQEALDPDEKILSSS